MPNPPRLRVAPLLDLAIIVAFILIGRGRHEIDEGVGWFLTVFWPLAVGWFGVALYTRLYSREEGVWRALAITLVAGFAVMCVLRGTFTDRPYFGIFTVIGFAFVGGLAIGWRAVLAYRERRRALTARA